MQHTSVKALLASALLLFGGLAVAAGFPERAVTLVAPFPPGGSADVLARMLARKLEEQWHQPVVVENKPGAGTAIGAAAVANARPDGHTLLLSSSSTFTLNPALQPRLQYDPAKGFAPVGIVGSVALALLVNPSMPASDVKQLVALVKANPDKYVYGSFGSGTSSNFAGGLFNLATGLKMTHVPYKGSAPLMTDLIGNQIPISFDTVVAAAPQRKNGKVKVLAVASARRSSLLSDVPTVGEAGYPGADLDAWLAVVAPAATPPAVREVLTRTVAKVIADPDTQQKMKAAGFEPGWRTVADWPGMIDGEIARMRALAQRADIHAE